eukprot:TRINITY_DN20523_c0_g1_i1.p2 TRINITY_DN20523_c0_g1~~TRINITY_DN20523_c0_g1_i1.p2  ORF type:complete len:103 (-),score=3.17 TRINITY_DN20523_c0_g1_i1:65-373(-)
MTRGPVAAAGIQAVCSFSLSVSVQLQLQPECLLLLPTAASLRSFSCFKPLILLSPTHTTFKSQCHALQWQVRYRRPCLATADAQQVDASKYSTQIHRQGHCG